MIRDAFLWLATTPVGRYMNDSTFGFAGVEAAHLLGLAVLGGVVLLLSLAVHWARGRGLGLARALHAVTHGPVKVLGSALGSLASSAGQLVEGGVADLCAFAPDEYWRVQADRLVSQGKHTPFSGLELPARVRLTLVAGTVAHDELTRDGGATLTA